VDHRPANVRLLQQLRRQLLEPPALERREGDVLAEPISPAARFVTRGLACRCFADAGHRRIPI
jgi:hypothetical protein